MPDVLRPCVCACMYHSVCSCMYVCLCVSMCGVHVCVCLSVCVCLCLSVCIQTERENHLLSVSPILHLLQVSSQTKAGDRETKGHALDISVFSLDTEGLWSQQPDHSPAWPRHTQVHTCPFVLTIHALLGWRLPEVGARPRLTGLRGRARGSLASLPRSMSPRLSLPSG